MSKREKYIDKLEAQLRTWNKQIDALQDKMGGQSEEFRTKAKQRLEVLKSRRSEMRKRLDQIKDSGEETFERLQGHTEKLWSDLKEGFKEIRSAIKS